MVKTIVSALAMFAIAVGVLADEPRRKDFPTDPRREGDVNGKLIKYDAEKSTILVGSGGEGKTEVTLLVDKHAQVLIDGKAGKLADIPEGTSVRLYLNQDRTTALSVQAQGSPQRRMITAVDASKRTVNFKREGGTEPVTVAADAPITIDGIEVKLDELKPGTQAILWLTLDQKTIRAISVPRKRGQPGGPDKPRKDGEKK